MDKLRNYELSFSGLKNGKHEFQFEIEKEFFQLFDIEQEFTNPLIMAKILLEKHSTFLEFLITTKGNVDLVCDITNETFQQFVENEVKVLVKFGEGYDDSNEEVITIPMESHAFNVSQLIYENVILSIPMKKISPNVSDEDIEALERFSPKLEEEIEDEEHGSDPRWDALKNLKNNN